MSLLRKNRDVCLIETNQSHHSKQLLLLFFLSMKTLCLSCFVGYHRSILYTFEISFHRFHSSFICLMCPHLMCFFSHTKILIFMFPLFDNTMLHHDMRLLTFWRRWGFPLSPSRSLLSLSCAENLWVLWSDVESPHSIYI